MSRLLNPSGWDRVGTRDSVEYELPSFSIIDIWNQDVADHIANQNCKEWGIVSIDPTPAQRANFKNDHIGFLRSQALVGLNTLLKKMVRAATDESQAEREQKESKKGGEADKRIINPKKFEDNVKLVEKWIEEVKSQNWSPSKYLKNQVKAKAEDEPWDYSAPSQAQA